MLQRRGHGPQIAALPGVTVREHAGLTSAALTDAGIASAAAAALVSQNDLDNFHAALRAQELNPDLRLAVADGTPRDPLARQHHPVRGALRTARDLLWNRFASIFGALLAVAVAGFALLTVAGHAPGNVFYLGIMDATGSALTNPGDTVAEKVAQVLLTVDGMALLPLLAAIIVGARLTGKVRGDRRGSAYRVGRTLPNTVSRSVSYLAAPAFAAAMLQQRVLRTVPVGRHVLSIADVRVEPGAAIDGRPPASLEGDGLARVLAIAGRGSTRFDWAPRRDRALAPGDRLIVLATQAGLSTFLAGERPPVGST